MPDGDRLIFFAAKLLTYLAEVIELSTTKGG